MPSSEDIDLQRELLQAHRRTLAAYLKQLALVGGTQAAPVGVTNGLAEARASIARVKRILRGWGVAVEDLPDDEAEAPAGGRGVPPVAPNRDPHLSVFELILEWRAQLTEQERRLWRRWVLAHIIGCVLLGFGLGGAQAGVLPRSLRVSRKTWFILSTVGLAGSFLIAVPTTEHWVLTEPLIGGVLFGGVVGAVLGVVQWWLLRRSVVQAGWWMLANAIAGGAGSVPLALLLALTENERSTPGASFWLALLIVLLLLGVISGSIAGITLIWLLRQPLPATPTPAPASGSAVSTAKKVDSLE